MSGPTDAGRPDWALAPWLEALDELRAQGLERRLRSVAAAPAPWVELPAAQAAAATRTVLLMGSNNYLGLAGDPRLAEAAAGATRRYGAGAGGARLTTGCLEIHRQLEQALAVLKKTDDALLFGSGYLANTGAIPALAGPGDLILSDALNHASLIDGCRLSRAEVRVFRHRDAAHAAELLRDREAFRRVLIVTDGVFGMDGDSADLPALARLAEQHQAWLYVDDAHGTGVLGETGAGTLEEQGLYGGVTPPYVIQMGTLSKALGSTGGFVAAAQPIIDYLRHRARSFVFATAPPAAASAAALAALEIVRAEPERRRRVRAHARRLQNGLLRRGFRLATPLPDAPIVSLLIGEAAATARFAARAEELGLWSPAIRPPTVPAGTGRLRITPMATHSSADIDRALVILQQAEKEEQLKSLW